MPFILYLVWLLSQYKGRVECCRRDCIPKKPNVLIMWSFSESQLTAALALSHTLLKNNVSPLGLEPCCSLCTQSLLYLWIPPSWVLPCALFTVWSSVLDCVDFFSLSGTRSQITTCSLHMSSIVRETQISHFTFFILNLYGSFGTLSKRTLRRRFSPTHHLLALLVGIYENWEDWVHREG